MPLFDPKVLLFENSPIKILAHLYFMYICIMYIYKKLKIWLLEDVFVLILSCFWGISRGKLFLLFVFRYQINEPQCLSVCLSVSLSVCRSVGLSVCRSVDLSVCRSIGLSVRWSVGLLVCRSIRK